MLSNYTAIGGRPAIKIIVDDLYERILADKILSPYFKNVNLLRVKAHQELLISQIIDEPHIYDGPSLQIAHEHLNITEEHFDRVVRHIVLTLKDAGVSGDLLDNIIATLVNFKSQIVSN